eukprot:TRINITY_DN1042_c0_g1_i32.p2 TRINITY_DN1042_c0_g1~~TRINITY_DN1042_c0_g1_i32.p2  ORF type:complete len:100 (+),score=3.50 TRINITY_DN1042_c0_g1_i32:123-422(+)
MMTIPAAAQRLDHTHFFRFGLLHGRPTSQFTCYERMQSQTVFPLDDVTLWWLESLITWSEFKNDVIQVSLQQAMNWPRNHDSENAFRVVLANSAPAPQR